MKISLFLMVFIITTFLFSASASATWLLDDYDYRQSITLTGNTSGAQTDYQLLLNVTYDSDMQTDFNDLRFANDTHQIDAWLESNTTDYVLIWVEFPTTPADSIEQNYYMYYGNNNIASDWDGNNTFLQYHNVANSQFIDSLDIIPSNIVYEARVKSTSDIHTIQWGISNLQDPDNDDSLTITSYSEANSRYILTRNESVATYYSEIPSFINSTYYRLKIIHNGSAVFGYVDEDRIGSTDITTNLPNENCGLFMDTPDGTGAQDWSFVRKYAANPATYAFGDEEFKPFLLLPIIIALQEIPKALTIIKDKFFNIIPFIISIILFAGFGLAIMVMTSKLKKW